MVFFMSESVVISGTTTQPPVPEAVLERARAAVREYFARCFWFWHPDHTVQTAEDVRLVIEQLREYGDHKAWKLAQGLHKCL